MKKSLFILFVLGLLSSHAQNTLSPANTDCGTSLPATYSQWRNSVISTQNLVSTLKHDLCVNKKFSIVFYVIADSSGTMGSITQAKLDTCVAKLNRAFGRICVSFLACSTVVIPNHPFNRWSNDTIEPVVRANWFTEKTINIYLPDTILSPFAGYAYYPGGPDAIVIKKSSITSNLVAIHEMGHFFGLTHTFDEIGTAMSPGPPSGTATYEFVDRSNCYTNGDGFCDTEADCYPLNKVLSAPCQNLHGAKDGHNDYYVPPVDNYMTYFTCGCRFTQEQYNFMANVMLNSRNYLH